ncbi:Cysteine synthase [Phycisphaerae bacterium RAS1]|nr:Cysteine synthase [Phycisphaerae bacterium RAS1]
MAEMEPQQPPCCLTPGAVSPVASANGGRCAHRCPVLAAGLQHMIGNTPLLAIDYRLDARPRRLFAKYEQRNMTGSIKDRMAAWIIAKAYEHDELHPGDTIVEATSGNTGISFAAIGRALGHPVRIYMPDWMSSERVGLIRSFGAEVVPISREAGGFLGSIEQAERFARQHDHVFLPRQFANAANIEAHEKATGPEIERQLAALGLRADAVIAGVGTGGTIMGLKRHLKRVNPRLAAHPLEPANSPTLREGHKVGRHRIQGISDEFVPPIVKLDELDDVIDVWDGDAILMAQALCGRLGLGVGISSGANFLGAVQLVERGDDGATVVTIFPDSNKKYLSTDFAREEPADDRYLTPRIELLRFYAVA